MAPPPTQVEYCHMRFIIASMPEAYSIHPYVQVPISQNAIAFNALKIQSPQPNGRNSYVIKLVNLTLE